MVDRINGFNFNPNKLPPNSEGFYNSPTFASHQIGFLSTLVSQEERANLDGLDQIKKAIKGET